MAQRQMAERYIDVKMTMELRVRFSEHVLDMDDVRVTSGRGSTKTGEMTDVKITWLCQQIPLHIFRHRLR